MVRVLVCGGRYYQDRGRVNAVLDKLHAEGDGIEVIIQGGARGADSIASDWADSHSVRNLQYDADWESNGTFAGPMRNKQMLVEGQPTLVIAFPGGKGTRNMMFQARDRGVKVIEIA